jgi:hypothetical protein
MRQFVAVFCALLFLHAVPARAQKILPESFSGWQMQSKTPITLADLNQTGNGIGADAAREYGFVSGEHTTYVSGSSKLDVTVYQMKDPSGAYGEYSFLRTDDMPRADLATHSSMSQDRALALAGNLVVEIRGSDVGKSSPRLKALVAAVQKHSDDGPLPIIQDFLPTNNLVERSDHYILGPVVLNQFFPVESGDWLGFSHGAEAEAARYHLNGKDLTLLIADYPTPQIAADELSRLRNRLNVNGSQQNAAGPALFAKRIVTKLTLVSGAASQDEANLLLNQIESGTQITWNEPTFQFKEPSIEMMVVGSIVGAGTLCLFAMIAGVAFGGFRLIVKRILPDKVFDRSNSLQIMQLGLASKPINSEDFYGIDGTPTQKVVIDKKMPERTVMRIFK